MSSNVNNVDRRSPSEWLILRQLRDTLIHSWASPTVEDAIELAERGGNNAGTLLSVESVRNAGTSTITVPHVPTERDGATPVRPEQFETETRTGGQQASRLHLPTLTSTIQTAVLLFTLYLLSQAIHQRTSQTPDNPSLTLSVVVAAATGDTTG